MKLCFEFTKEKTCEQNPFVVLIYTYKPFMKKRFIINVKKNRKEKKVDSLKESV